MIKTKYIVHLFLAFLFAASPFWGMSQKNPDKKKKKKAETAETSHSDPSAQDKKKTLTPKEIERVNYLFVEGTTQYIQGNEDEAIELFKQVLVIDGENDASLFNIGKINFENEKYDEAVVNLKGALDLDPGNGWYYTYLADCYDKMEEFDHAQVIREKQVKKFPEDKEAMFGLAQDYIFLNRLQDASKIYDDIEKKVGFNEEVIYRKHTLYIYLNQPDKAMIEINKLIANNPQDSRYLQAKYDLLVKTGDKAGAMLMLEDILKANPDNGFALITLADHYRVEGQMTKSDEYLFKAFESNSIQLEPKLGIMVNLIQSAQTDPRVAERARKLSDILVKVHPNSAKVYGIRGDFFRVMKSPDSARVNYRMAVKMEPTNEDAWEQLILMDSRAGDFESMKTDTDKAVEYFPNQPSFLYLNGVANNQTGHYEEAAYSLEKVKKYAGENKKLKNDAMIQLGEVYHKAGNYPKSTENFESALANDPEDVLVLNNYAYFLSLRNENLAKAEEMILKVLKKSPNEANYLDTYGWVLYVKGEYQKAAEQIEKAISFDGNNAEILEHYGDIQYKLGNKEKASEYWKKAKDAGAKNLNLDQKLKDEQPR